ncbi:hypothetical protein COCSADRAFT_23933 [Bipolaris sorokiniana ND90Pr]|uniref:Uncharacterized protein n=1 Tax=Cochliobolus sativus (strain ND90Pr / ATCC 201652) TaxID=665912 RepID=M2TEA5_COCSN|nr:uncharacterized protein COCSADRAFT_23933 [Bipolaris sorokiniana ND90Pr]EMD67571.1 hypothetical protein COCSADRAFT_23933 [Bipolaris sorokiniana ND90Pr]
MIGAPRGASYAVPSTPREEASTATTPASVRCNSANLQPRVVVRDTEGRARHYAATPKREASHDKPAGDDPHWDSRPGLPNSRACQRGRTRTPLSKQSGNVSTTSYYALETCVRAVPESLSAVDPPSWSTAPFSAWFWRATMAIYVSPNRAWLGRPRWDDPHTAHETATPWVCSHLGQYPGSALRLHPGRMSCPVTPP